MSSSGSSMKRSARSRRLAGDPAWSLSAPAPVPALDTEPWTSISTPSSGVDLAGSALMGSTEAVSLGKTGEDLACLALTRQGYAILARRYRTRVGEIDIVAADGDTVVFVEVKARRDTRCGAPAEAVTWWKQRRIITMARFYLATHRCQQRPVRFDVVSVLAPRGAAPTVEIIRGAFTADGW